MAALIKDLTVNPIPSWMADISADDGVFLYVVSPVWSTRRWPSFARGVKGFLSFSLSLDVKDCVWDMSIGAGLIFGLVDVLGSETL